VANPATPLGGRQIPAPSNRLLASTAMPRRPAAVHARINRGRPALCSHVLFVLGTGRSGRLCPPARRSPDLATMDHYFTRVGHLSLPLLPSLSRFFSDSLFLQAPRMRASTRMGCHACSSSSTSADPAFLVLGGGSTC
jgi:hypothetical protein